MIIMLLTKESALKKKTKFIKKNFCYLNISTYETVTRIPFTRQNLVSYLHNFV
jgi:hypothetical protein